MSPSPRSPQSLLLAVPSLVPTVMRTLSQREVLDRVRAGQAPAHVARLLLARLAPSGTPLTCLDGPMDPRAVLGALAAAPVAWTAAEGARLVELVLQQEREADVPPATMQRLADVDSALLVRLIRGSRSARALEAIATAYPSLSPSVRAEVLVAVTGRTLYDHPTDDWALTHELARVTRLPFLAELVQGNHRSSVQLGVAHNRHVAQHGTDILRTLLLVPSDERVAVAGGRALLAQHAATTEETDPTTVRQRESDVMQVLHALTHTMPAFAETVYRPYHAREAREAREADRRRATELGGRIQNHLAFCAQLPSTIAPFFTTPRASQVIDAAAGLTEAAERAGVPDYTVAGLLREPTLPVPAAVALLERFPAGAMLHRLTFGPLQADATLHAYLATTARRRLADTGAALQDAGGRTAAERHRLWLVRDDALQTLIELVGRPDLDPELRRQIGLEADVQTYRPRVREDATYHFACFQNPALPTQERMDAAEAILLDPTRREEAARVITAAALGVVPLPMFRQLLTDPRFAAHFTLETLRAYAARWQRARGVPRERRIPLYGVHPLQAYHHDGDAHLDFEDLLPRLEARIAAAEAGRAPTAGAPTVERARRGRAEIDHVLAQMQAADALEVHAHDPQVVARLVARAERIAHSLASADDDRRALMVQEGAALVARLTRYASVTDRTLRLQALLALEHDSVVHLRGAHAHALAGAATATATPDQPAPTPPDASAAPARRPGA